MKRVLVSCMAVVLTAGACSSPVDPPAPNAEHRAALTVLAIRQACGALCEENPFYVRDQLLDVDTLVGEEQPMPVEISRAIRDAFPSVMFTDFAEADQVIGQVDNREAALLNVAPLANLGPGLVGVDVGVSYGPFHGQTIQFKWDGSAWVAAESDDTGVTVTSVVS